MRSRAHERGSWIAFGVLALMATGGHAQTLELGEPTVRTAQGPWSAQVLDLLEETPETSFAAALVDVARRLANHAGARPGEAAAALLLAHSVVHNAETIAAFALGDAVVPMTRAMVQRDLEAIAANPPTNVAAFERELRDALAPLAKAAFAPNASPGTDRAGWVLPFDPAPVDALVVRARVEAGRAQLPGASADRILRLVNACEDGAGHPAYARSARATLAELARAAELADPPGWLSEEAASQTRLMFGAIANTTDPSGRAELLARGAELSRLLKAVGVLPDGAARSLAQETLNDRLAEEGATLPGLAWLMLARRSATEALQTPDRPVPDGFVRALRPAWVAARKDEQQTRAALLQLVPRILASESSINDPAVLAAVGAARESGLAFERLERFNAAATAGAGGTARPVASRPWKDITDRAGELSRTNPAALRDMIAQAARFSRLPGEREMRAAMLGGTLGAWSPSLGGEASRLLDTIEQTRARWREAWADAARTEDVDEAAEAMEHLERLAKLAVADNRIARAEDDSLAAWPGWPMSASARTLLATDLRIGVITASERMLGIDTRATDDDGADPPEVGAVLELAERVAAPALARVALAQRMTDRVDPAGTTVVPSPTTRQVRRALGLIALGPPVHGREWLAVHRHELAGLAAATEQRVAAELDNHDDLADLYAGLAREHAEAVLDVLAREE